MFQQSSNLSPIPGHLADRMNTISSSILALAIACLVFELTYSAPLSQVERQIRDVDRDAKVAASSKKLLRTLRLLLERRVMEMAIDQVLATGQGKSSDWVYLPLSKVKSEGSEEEEEESDGSPMDKAKRKHFKVSEPGTGPVLNHPLSNIDAGLDRDTMIEALINELMATAK